MNQQQPRALPSFSGLSSAVNEARDYEKRSSGQQHNHQQQQQHQQQPQQQQQQQLKQQQPIMNSSSRRGRVSSPTETTPMSGLVVGGGGGGRGVAVYAASVPSRSESTSKLLVQDTLSPLLDEVDALFDRSKEIIASLQAVGKQPEDEDVEVEIMERMAEAWQDIEAKNSRHETAHKLHREKPMFCMDSLGKRIKAALLCKTLPKDDNPAEYVNGSSSAPSRNLVTAIKLAGYVVHCGTGGKVSTVDGDGREPPSMYTKEEFQNNVLPRAAENQPPRILNELRQLSCRLVASGISRGLLKAEDLPEIRKILVSRFEDGGMHFLAGGDAAFTRFIGVAANAHRLLERGEVDEFVRFHERVVKLVGMCRNRVRRAAYATSKNMLAQADGTGRFVVGKTPASRRKSAPLLQQAKQQRQQPAPAPPIHAAPAAAAGTAQTHGPIPWRSGHPAVAIPPAAGVHGRPAQPPSISVQGQFDAPPPSSSIAHPSSAPYGSKSPPKGGGSGSGSAGFGGSSGFSNGGAIARAARAVLPVDNQPPGASARNPNDRSIQTSYAVQVSDTSNGDGGVAATPAAAAAAAVSAAPPFHDHNALGAAAPEILTQMGYRRAPAFGPEAAWSAGAGPGASRAEPAAPAPAAVAVAPVMRMDAPSVLVLQPGWGVTLPPYFLGMMDPKRPRSIPVKMLWELRAEPYSGIVDTMLVEMRQVPGYLDFLAEIMPADMLKFRWPLRCWETVQGKHDSRALLEEAAAALYQLGLVPMPPGSALRQVYDEYAARRGAMAAIGLSSVSNNSTSSGSSTSGSNINVGSSNTQPANPAEAGQLCRGHAGGHVDGGVLHAASLGVPPVAAGVLRDMHRQGVLNGEAAKIWGNTGSGGGGDGSGGGGSGGCGAPSSISIRNSATDRELGSPSSTAPPPPAPAPGSATGLPPQSGGSASSGGSGSSGTAMGGGGGGGGGDGATVGGHWLAPPALPPGKNTSLHPNTSHATDPANHHGVAGAASPSANSNANAAVGKRKAGAAFPDAAVPAGVATEW